MEPVDQPMEDEQVQQESEEEGDDDDDNSSSSEYEDDDDEPMVPSSVDHHALLSQVQAARQAMQQGAPHQAAPFLLRAVHTVPALLPELEQELAQALEEYAGTLVGQGKAKEALWLLDGATRSIPQGKLLWLEQGRLCFRLRQHLRALHSFQRALALDPRCPAALDALESLKSLSVDRWHFRMLNDRPRNEAYRAAVQLVVAEETARLGRKPVVLDIGTGTGLLALLALEAGAEQVYACETNPVLANMARAIVAAHGPAAKDAIVVINKASQELRVGEDLPVPVDIVVTELVDSGLLGEHILPVLRHARAALLRPGGRTIPHSVRVNAAIIESPDARRRARLLPEAVRLLGLPTSYAEVARAVGVDEAYTCENLELLHHTQLSREPLEVAGDLSLVDDASAHFRSSVDFVGDEDGQADAVAFSFELDLVSPLRLRGNRIAFSTAERRSQNGWDQAVYFLLPTDINRRPFLEIGHGGHYRLETAVVHDQLAFRLTDTQYGSTVASKGFPCAEGSPPEPVVRVGEADLAQLNDTRRLRAYGDAIGLVIARALARAGGDPARVRARVVEWSGDFSGLGLVALRAPGVGGVTVLTGSDESAAALHAWLAKTTAAAATTAAYAGAAAPAAPLPDVSVRVLRFRAGSDATVVAPALLGLREEAHGGADAEAEGPPPVILVHDLVEGSGLIRQGALQEALLARDLLGPQALVPQGFRVVMQCLTAPALLAQNRLDPANTLGLKLEALDGLGVSTFRELDLAELCRDRRAWRGEGEENDCTPLSGPCPALAVDLRTTRVEPGDEVLGRARVSVPVTDTGTLQAVAFWFELELAEGAPVLSTGPCAAPKRGRGEGEEGRLSSYRQAAVLLPEGQAVQPGQTVQVEVVCTLSRGVDIFLVAPG